MSTTVSFHSLPDAVSASSDPKTREQNKQELVSFFTKSDTNINENVSVRSRSLAGTDLPFTNMDNEPVTYDDVVPTFTDMFRGVHRTDR